MREEGLELPGLSKAFDDDVLLAVTCREHGVALVTENVRDFERIRNVFDFDFDVVPASPQLQWCRASA